MNGTQLTAAVLAVLLVGAGAVAAGTVVATDESSTADRGPATVDVRTTYDNGTVTATVTSNGTGVENVSVEANGESVGTTGADGAVTFETNDTEELELELEKGEFEGELEYVIQDGSLVLQKEEYEYAEVEPEEDDAEDDDADDEDADDDEPEEADEADDADEDDGDDEKTEDADDDADETES